MCIRDSSYGAISARPGWDIASGKYLIRAVASFADDTEVSEVIPLTVTRGSDAERFSPSVVGEVFLSNDPDDVVRTAVADSGSEPLPESATFGFSTSEGLSEVDSYGVGQINPSTGELKFTPRADMKAGTYTSVVRVSYADGSFDDVNVVFHVGGSFMSSLYSPVVPVIEVARRGSATSKVPRNAVASTPLPEQVVFKPGRFMPEWASLAEDGSVTVRPDLNVRPGTYTLYALAQYPDSSVDEVAYTVKVLPSFSSISGYHYKRHDGIGAKVGRALDQMLGTGKPGQQGQQPGQPGQQPQQGQPQPGQPQPGQLGQDGQPDKSGHPGQDLSLIHI